MCANPQSNWLNSIAVRASYNFPILKRFPLASQKTRGWSITPLPPRKNQNMGQFVFLSFGVNPFNWQSFTDFGEMACSTTAGYSSGHTSKICQFLRVTCKAFGRFTFSFKRRRKKLRMIVVSGKSLSVS